jgi:hypothetical protein
VVPLATFTSIATQLVDFLMKNLECMLIDLFMLGKLNMLPDLIGTIRCIIISLNFDQRVEAMQALEVIHGLISSLIEISIEYPHL